MKPTFHDQLATSSALITALQAYSVTVEEIAQVIAAQYYTGTHCLRVAMAGVPQMPDISPKS